jgi:hypothetical protein
MKAHSNKKLIKESDDETSSQEDDTPPDCRLDFQKLFASCLVKKRGIKNNAID